MNIHGNMSERASFYEGFSSVVSEEEVPSTFSPPEPGLLYRAASGVPQLEVVPEHIGQSKRHSFGGKSPNVHGYQRQHRKYKDKFWGKNRKQEMGRGKRNLSAHQRWNPHPRDPINPGTFFLNRPRPDGINLVPVPEGTVPVGAPPHFALQPSLDPTRAGFQAGMHQNHNLMGSRLSSLRPPSVISRSNSIYEECAQPLTYRPEGNIASGRHRTGSEDEMVGRSSRTGSISSGSVFSRTSFFERDSLVLGLPVQAEQEPAPYFSPEVGAVVSDMVNHLALPELELESKCSFVGRRLLQFEAYVDSALKANTLDSPFYSGHDAQLVQNLMQQIVSNVYPYAKVEMYGSLSTGLWLPGQSDLDLLIDFQKHIVPEDSITRFYPAAKKPPLGANAEIIPETNSTEDNSIPPIVGDMPNDGLAGGMSPQERVLDSCYERSWYKFLTELYLQSRDLELDDLTREQIIEVLGNLHSVCSSHTWCWQAKLVPSGMPVLKLQISMGMQKIIPTDISVLTSEHMGLQARDYICSVVSQFPGLFRPLVLMIKQLLRQQGMNDVYTGGLGSYSISLMVIFLLKRCGYAFRGSVYDQRNPSFSSSASTTLSGTEDPYERFSWRNHEKEKSAKFPPNFYLSPGINTRPVRKLQTENTRPSWYKPGLSREDFGRLQSAEKTVQGVVNWTKDFGGMLESNVGMLFLGFLKLFSPVSEGGLDLNSLGLTVTGKGSFFVHNRPVCLSIRDPVAKENFVGEGSFNMAQVQQFFHNCFNEAFTDPESFFEKLEWKPIQKPPSSCPPVYNTMEAFGGYSAARFSAFPNNRRNASQYMARADHYDTSHMPLAKQRLPSRTLPRTEHLSEAKKPAIDVNRMSEQLEAAIKARELKQRKLKNLEKFLQGSDERKRILSAQQLMRGGSRGINAPNFASSQALDKDFGGAKNVKTAKEQNFQIIGVSDERRSRLEGESVNLISPHRPSKQASDEATPDSAVSWAKVVKKKKSSPSPIAYGDSEKVQEKVKESSRGRVIKAEQPRARQNGLEDSTTLLGNRRKEAIHATIEKLKSGFRTETLFVGNISYNATEKDIGELINLFRAHGPVLNHLYNQKKGTLWIQFSSIKDSMSALESLDQRTFIKRPLYVDFSQFPRPNKGNWKK